MDRVFDKDVVRCFVHLSAVWSSAAIARNPSVPMRATLLMLAIEAKAQEKPDEALEAAIDLLREMFKQGVEIKHGLEHVTL